MTGHAPGGRLGRRAFLQRSAAVAGAMALGVRTLRATAGSALLPSTFRPSVLPSDRPSVLPSDRLQWWRESRFGMFIHWGLYAILAGARGGRDAHAEGVANTPHRPARA